MKLNDFIQQDQVSRFKKQLGYTAISRKSPSRPMRFLQEHDLLKGRMLDYGCGRGTDAKFFGMDAYDPFWMPDRPTGTFDTITCHYVLNVVDQDMRNDIIADIHNLLDVSGTAYLTVRRDMKQNYRVYGYTQSIVVLELPSLEKNNSYEIYKLEK